jgi:hypothetical protein
MDANEITEIITKPELDTHETARDEPDRLRDYGEQGENGYDLSMFRENLRLTPTERIEKLERALALYFEVKRAGEEYRLSRRNSRAR